MMRVEPKIMTRWVDSNMSNWSDGTECGNAWEGSQTSGYRVAEHQVKFLPEDKELSEWLQELNKDGHFFFSDIENDARVSNDAKNSSINRSRGLKRKMSLPQELLQQENPVKRTPSGSTAGSTASKPLTAMEIFNSYVDVQYDNDGNKQLDCSKILSRACYEKWLQTRQSIPSKPEECFRKCLLAHITCSDGGSSPFDEEVEKALLKLLRKTGKVWECFKNSYDQNGKKINIGIKGLRCQGFHEKQRLSNQGPANSNHTPSPHSRPTIKQETMAY